MKKLSSVTISGGLTVDQATTLSGVVSVGGIGTGAYTSVLVRNSSNQMLYRNYSDFVNDISGSLNLSGYVPTSRTLTINGTTYDLSADRTWTINTVAYTSRLQHQVKAGVAINKGQAVYVTSADGTNMIVGLASNASEATSSKTMGLLDATVSTNGFANVVTEGLLAGLDTTAANAEGDPVWLGTGGNLIYGLANKPYAPAHLVFIGIVTRRNANNGEIFVKVQNGFELREIHDVDLITTVPVNGHILGFDGTLWVNKTIAGWLGYTPANASGTTNYISKFTGSTTLGNSQIYDDGSNVGIGTTTMYGKLSISSGNFNGIRIDTNGGGYSALNIGGTGALTVDAPGITGGRFQITDSGNVGIGTPSPNQKLHIKRTETVNRTTYTDILTIDADANNSPYTGHGGGILFRGTTYSGSANNVQGNRIWGRIGMFLNDFYDGFNGESMFFAVAPDDRSDALTTAMTIQYNGNVGIGTTAPSYKLDVNGETRLGKLITTWSNSPITPSAVIYSESGYNTVFAGNGQFSSSYLALMTNGNMSYMGGNVGIGTGSPNQKLSVEGGSIQLNANNVAANYYLYLNKKSGQDGGILFNRDNANDWQLTNGAGNGDLVFYSYGTSTEAITFKRNTGNVGIGTTTPYEKLEVNGAISATGAVNGTSAQGHSTTLAVQSGTSFLYAVDWGAEFKPISVQAKTISLETGTGSTTSRLFIDNSGNVGIGTTSPIYKLQVAGSAYVNGGTLFLDSSQYLRWGNSNQGIVGVNDDHVAIVSGGATRQTIYADGRTYFPGLDLSISNVNSSHGTGTYFRGSSTHFVLGLNNGNTLYLNYGNDGGSLQSFGTWSHQNVQILSTTRVLTNVSGNISMFTNDAGYLTSYSETDTLQSVTSRGSSTNTTLTSTAQLGLYVNSGSASYIGVNSTSNWAYVSLLNNGSTTWDIGAYNGGGLEFRPYGSGNNAMYLNLDGSLFINSLNDGKLNLRVPSGDSSDWNYINFIGSNGVRDTYFGTDSGGTPTWWRDDNGVNITLGSSVLINGNTAWHAGNDGSGSGLDADTVDGIDSGSFLRSDVSDSFSGTLTMATQRAFIPSNYGHGLYGIYSAERYQHVWSMGAGYDLPADGVSNGNGGSLYGLAWSYNPDYSYVGSNAQSKPGLNHQLLLMMNGITHTALGSGIWTSGTITTTSHGNSSQWNTAYGWGNHATAGYLTSYSETDTLASVTNRGNSTTNRINVRGIGNQSGGNIMIGDVGEGTNKWSYLTGTHYNATSQPQGFALIGGLSTSGGNAVVIGGNIYETNPATEIQFWTHSDTTHNLGGTQRGVINLVGNWGIGTNSPTEKLHVNGDTRIVGNTYVGGIINAYQGDASIWVPNLGQAFTVKQTTGNVGVGTSSPSEKLHVSGAAIFDGGAGNSSTDAVVYITKSTNDDWGLYVNNAGLDYGMYTRTSPSANYAFALHNGTTWTTRITGNGNFISNEKLAISSTDSWLRLNQNNDFGQGVYTPGVMRADGGFNVSGNTVWHAANDGSGSGLDADLLDGQDSSVFLRLLPGGAEASLDSYTDNGVRSVSFAGHSQHLLSWNAGGSTGTVQQLFHYGTPNNGWRIRNKTDNNSWSDWGYVVMASSNQGLISGTIATQSWVGSQSYATTSYVTTQINNLINGAPGALDTLSELASALGNDASFATTVTNSIAGKVSKSGDTITGKITFPSSVSNRPQFPGGVLGIDTGDGEFDIWGISRDYYPSHPTAANAWGLEWYGIENQFRFVGAGSRVITLDMDNGIISTISHGNSTQWNTAYGWGDHSSVGYALNSSLANYLPLSGGVIGGAVTINGNLTVNGTITENSSIKLKENVETSEGNLEKVVNLRPVTYNKIGSQTTELGLIAEEVAEVYPEFVQYDENGEPIGVHYSRLTAALIGAVKELTKRIETLENNG